jgi:hypothetical protein
VWLAAIVNVFLGLKLLGTSWVPFLLVSLWLLATIIILGYLQKKVGQTVEKALLEDDDKPRKPKPKVNRVVVIGYVVVCLALVIGVIVSISRAPPIDNSSVAGTTTSSRTF